MMDCLLESLERTHRVLGLEDDIFRHPVLARVMSRRASSTRCRSWRKRPSRRLVREAKAVAGLSGEPASGTALGRGPAAVVVGFDAWWTYFDFARGRRRRPERRASLRWS